jgi:hypothetical protein
MHKEAKDINERRSWDEVVEKDFCRGGKKKSSHRYQKVPISDEEGDHVFTEVIPTRRTRYE